MSRHERTNYPVDLTGVGSEILKEELPGSMKPLACGRHQTGEKGAQLALPDYRALIAIPQSNTS